MRAPSQGPLPDRVAGALVFCASGAVLVLEILAGRLLAPYTGVTRETYTAIIGVVLAGIATGTWAGGRLADRRSPRRTLGPLLVAGGLLALATVPAVRILGALAVGRAGSSSAIILLALLSFFPPAAVLSAVSPTVVKLQLEHLEETGTVVGRLSALGTAGAIAGTFVTGFVLVAALPSTPIVLLVGGSLIVAGLVLAVRGGGISSRSSALLVAVAALLAGGALAIRGPCQVESAYYCARVAADPANADGRVLRLDVLDHAYVDLDDPRRLKFRYVREIGDLVDALAPRGASLRALHVGGGGFTLPRYIAATRPGSENVVLELDPEVVRLGRERLGLRTSPAMRVRVGDARVGVREQPAGRYDLVVGDAYGGLAVPWHLTTREFLADVRRSMRPGGVFAANIIDLPPLAFARAEAATLLRSFRHVAIIAPPEFIAGRAGGNFVMLASDAPLPLAAMARVRESQRRRDVSVDTAGARAFAGDAFELTDGFAPVDQLLTPARG